MASLISWLAYDGARTSTGAAVASGKAWFYQPGTTSTQVTVFSDADGLYALTQPVALDAGGRAAVYADRIVQCEVQTAAGATVRLSDRANAVTAAQVEIQNTVATGTSLTTGSQVEGGRTDLDVFLSNLRTSLGAADGNVDMAGTPRLIKDAIRVLTHWFDVTTEPYGATGDGVTDDTTAIQAAITAANASGGGVVFLPPGTFIVSSLTVPATISFIGCGSGKSILRTSSAAEVLLVAAGAFTAYGLQFETTGKGLLRYTSASDTATVLTACAFSCTNAATAPIAGLVGGSTQRTTFDGCNFTQTGTGGTAVFLNHGCTVIGGTFKFVSGRMMGGDFMTFVGVYIEYSNAAVGDLRTAGTGGSFAPAQTMFGCTLAVTSAAAAIAGGSDFVEIGSSGNVNPDSGQDLFRFSEKREAAQTETSGSAISYTPVPRLYKRFFVTSTGASFAWGNPAITVASPPHEIFLWYKNTSGGAITPTLGASYKGSSVSVASGSACGWHFSWDQSAGLYRQIGSPVAYTA